jgi:hypothetical protein
MSRGGNDATAKGQGTEVQEKSNQETGTEGFTKRAVMSLVMESSELMETAKRVAAVVAALALTYGISIEV